MISISLILIFISCAASKEITSNRNYTFDKHKSKNGYSTLILKAYDYEYENQLGPRVYINDLYFDFSFDSESKIIKPFDVSVEQEGKYTIRFSYLGRLPVKIPDFFIKKGDSIVISAYLKEDPTPLH
ncbi:hypothetical protein [Tenacibaculum agarivorans]|uniref:hypothetical protein n=1 Tax=Tenacibaculum agarivorans TaxID=1908389 RepID=UPI00118166E3|nr:hypothetical protein [Tenacibaculum agarivorans]